MLKNFWFWYGSAFAFALALLSWMGVAFAVEMSTTWYLPVAFGLGVGAPLCLVAGYYCYVFIDLKRLDQFARSVSKKSFVAGMEYAKQEKGG